jgi:hypothetical protein
MGLRRSKSSLLQVQMAKLFMCSQVFLISSPASKQCKSLMIRVLNETIRARGCGDQCKYLCRCDNFSNFLLGARLPGVQRARALFCFAIGARIIPLALFTYKGNNTCTFYGWYVGVYVCVGDIHITPSSMHTRGACIHIY